MKISLLSCLAVSCLALPVAVSGAEVESAQAPPQSIDKGAYVPTDVFGTRGGYVHPFMSVTLENSDNINNTATNEFSDWKAIYAPGIWLAAPAQREIFLNLNTANTSPGGHYQQLNKQEGFSRYQAYALYVADIDRYDDHDERDTIRQSAEGFFQYNFRGGLSIDIYDKFKDSEDPMATGDSTIIDEYKSNLVGLILDYDATDKVRLRFDYNNFHLRYDDLLSQGQDRDDNSYALYTYYNYSPKTSIFAEYEFVDVKYDTNTVLDTQQHYGYLGMEWLPTGKTTLAGKVGYGQRQGDIAAVDDSGPVLELSVNHDFTVKTSINILAMHKFNETTVASALYSQDSSINVLFSQIITDKIGLAILADYTKMDFMGPAAQDRTDYFYTLAPTLRYSMQEWLGAEIGYEYIQRESNLDVFDYTTNSAFLRLSAGF
ncbi:MAG: outer membrane beta-barrel protein [Thermodesulfobacteriota bacterium]